MNVDLTAVDWGTAVARYAQKSPPGQGGWQIHLFWTSAGVSAMHPGFGLIRANGATRRGNRLVDSTVSPTRCAPQESVVCPSRRSRVRQRRGGEAGEDAVAEKS
jgi:hypothetical protein